MLVVNVEMHLGELPHFQKDRSLRGMKAICLQKGKIKPLAFQPPDKNWSLPTTVAPYVPIEAVVEVDTKAKQGDVAWATHQALKSIVKQERGVIRKFLEAKAAILFVYTLHESVVITGGSKNKGKSLIIAYADKYFVGMVQGKRRLHSMRWGSDAKPGYPVSFCEE